MLYDQACKYHVEYREGWRVEGVLDTRPSK